MENRIISEDELKVILRMHKLWLDDQPDGGRADLRRANLRAADLRGANLRRANLRAADLFGANLSGANLRRANLRGADLRAAGLRAADLRGADLSGADLDYSCWPLWCGSLETNVDNRIAAQIAYHFCRLDCDDPEFIEARNAILDFANKFHLVDECGELKPIPKPQKED